MYKIRGSKDRNLLYAPLRGIAIVVNDDAFDLLKCLQDQSEQVSLDELSRPARQFISVVERVETSPRPDMPEEPEMLLKPTAVTLLPTFDCNLRCVYCYAGGGESSQVSMPTEVGRAAVDLVVQNAVESGKDTVRVSLHGGGEPTVAWPLLVDVVPYARDMARDKGLELHIHLTTNGVLGASQRQWIVDNVDHVQISFDGPPDIQNSQRPVAGGRPSFPYVMDTIRFLDDSEAAYGIQSVVTESSVRRMVEMVDFFCGVSDARSLQLEPVFECGRCPHTSCRTPEPAVFAEHFLRAWKHGASRSRRVTCSSVRLKTLTAAFCGAAGRNFFVTPEGYVTACLEVSSPKDPRSEAFTYGRYRSTEGQFALDLDRLRALASRTVYNMPACESCPFRWHCGGECLAKSMYSGDIWDPTATDRCELTRTLCTDMLLAVSEEPKLAPMAGIELSTWPA